MRAGDDVEQRGLAGLVALGARQPAGVGPPAVAVHDDRDVPRARSSAGTRRRPRPATGAGTARAYGLVVIAGRLGSRRSTSRSERTPALEVPLQEGGDQPAALAAVPRRRSRRRRAQSPASSAASSSQRLAGRARAEPGGRQAGQTAPPAGDVERPVRPGRAAPRAVVEARRPAGDGEGAQQVGVEHQARGRARRRPASAGRRRAAGTAAVAGSCSSVSRSAVSSIAVRGGVGGVVAGDRVAVRRERLGLRHGVEERPS